MEIVAGLWPRKTVVQQNAQLKMRQLRAAVENIRTWKHNGFLSVPCCYRRQVCTKEAAVFALEIIRLSPLVLSLDSLPR